MKLKRLSLVALFSLSVVGCTTAPNTLAVNATQKLIQFERNKANLEKKGSDAGLWRYFDLSRRWQY